LSILWWQQGDVWLSSFLAKRQCGICNYYESFPDSFVEGVQVVETFNLGGLNGEG